MCRRDMYGPHRPRAGQFDNAIMTDHTSVVHCLTFATSFDWIGGNGVVGGDNPDWLGRGLIAISGRGGVHDPKDADGNIVDAAGGDRFFDQLTTRLLGIVRADDLEDVRVVHKIVKSVRA
jgi:hypothetical protein